MNAIILAAGRGRRLASMGWNRPKCLLEFGGQTLLDRILSTLIVRGIERVTLVVGFEKKQLEAAARRHRIDAHFVLNPDYESTNTIHSLWFARDTMTASFLYFNADVLFDPAIVTRLLEQSGSALAIDEKRCGAEEVKVVTTNTGRIVRISKKLDPESCVGEFIGLARFDTSICRDLVAKLDDFNNRRRQRGLFFEAALDDLLDAHDVRAMSIGDLTAIEIDTPEDYAAALKLKL